MTMAWLRVDDKLPTHRKTRAALRGVAGKRRDASAMGLWVLAGAWARDNRTDGWVPADELLAWDDDGDLLAERLTAAGLWSPCTRDGEPGYQFHDWAVYNSTVGGLSDSGRMGAHRRWHAARGVVDPECELCPSPP